MEEVQALSLECNLGSHGHHATVRHLSRRKLHWLRLRRRRGRLLSLGVQLEQVHVEAEKLAQVIVGQFWLTSNQVALLSDQITNLKGEDDHELFSVSVSMSVDFGYY